MPDSVGRGVTEGKEVGSRAAFADWLTAPENPRFALVIANRLSERERFT